MPSRAAIFLILLAIVVPLGGQQDVKPPARHLPDDQPPAEVRLPNGKLQMDEILKSDRERSMQDAKQLVDMAQALEKDIEQSNSQQVLSLVDIRRTEEIEKIAKRIRGRMRRN